MLLPCCRALSRAMFGFYVLSVLLFLLLLRLARRPTQKAPFTCVVIGLCCLHFAAMMIWARRFDALNPMLGPRTEALLHWGAQTTQLVREDGEYERLVLSMFVHAGLIHLLLNSMSLYNLGFSLEHKLGSVRVATIYASSGLFAALLSALVLPCAVCVGASGAIFGVFGAVWSDFLQNSLLSGSVPTAHVVEQVSQLLPYTLYAAVLSLMPMVNAAAHLGGFAYGFLAGNVLVLRPARGCCGRAAAAVPLLDEPSSNRLQFAVAVLSFGTCVWLMAWTWGLLQIRANIFASCSWCHYLECVDTPFWRCADRATACDWPPAQLPSPWHKPRPWYERWGLTPSSLQSSTEAAGEWARSVKDSLTGASVEPNPQAPLTAPRLSFEAGARERARLRAWARGAGFVPEPAEEEPRAKGLEGLRERAQQMHASVTSVGPKERLQQWRGWLTERWEERVAPRRDPNSGVSHWDWVPSAREQGIQPGTAGRDFQKWAHSVRESVQGMGRGLRDWAQGVKEWVQSWGGQEPAPEPAPARRPRPRARAEAEEEAPSWFTNWGGRGATREGERTVD